MDRRELFIRSSAAAAGILAGNAFGEKVFAGSQDSRKQPFGRFGEEKILGDFQNPLVDDGIVQRPASAAEIGDQFFVFQLVPTADNRWFIRSPQEIRPKLETTNEYPDVVLDTRLISFHVGED